MPNVSELIPAKIEDLRPEIFVAVDVMMSSGGTRRIVGTIMRLSSVFFVLQYAGSPDEVYISHSAVKAVYFAPMGYRG